MKNLKEKYDRVFYTNFIHSEFIKDILLKTKWENCDINTFSLMYLMGLSNTYYREIVPKLKEQYIVVLDRYIYTIISKNIVSNEIKNDKWINSCLEIFRKPDIKIYIDTSISECLKRKKENTQYLSYWECGGNIFYDESLRQAYDENRYSENFLKYQTKIQEIYKKYIKKEEDWLIIDGNNSKENISKQMLKVVIDKIEEGRI